MAKQTLYDLQKRLGLLVLKKEARIKSISLKKDITKDQRAFINDEQEFIATVRAIINQFDGNRIPPNATDLEEAILGAVILQPGSLKSIEFLKSDHFFSPVHREIYSSIQYMVKLNDPIDMRTVVLRLRKDGKIELIGGSYYIAELTSKVSSAANIEYHARVLVEFAMKRQLIAMAYTIVNEAHDDTVDVFEQLRTIQKELTIIMEPVHGNS